MKWTKMYKLWFVKKNKLMETFDKTKVEVWKFEHILDTEILSPLAKRFRREYCLDSDLDDLCKNSGHSTYKEYLQEKVFPNPLKERGPSTRSGDFGEFLAANFLEFVKGCWIPKHRFINREVPEEPTKGCDVIAFRLQDKKVESEKDALVICEVKTRTKSDAVDALQNAIKDTKKSPEKIAVSLNAIKRRLLDKHLKSKKNKEFEESKDAKIVARFQNTADIPYREIHVAFAVIDNLKYSSDCITSTDASSHQEIEELKLVVLRGDNLFEFLNDLYERAANET